MKQTIAGTMLETGVDVGIGFAFAWVINFFILPLWGFEANVQSVTEVTLVYTFIAIVRKFAVRRAMEWWRWRLFEKA